GNIIEEMNFIIIFPATQYVIDKDKMDVILDNMTKDMEEQVKRFADNNKLIEAQRLSERTRYDRDVLREAGFCRGIENYERYLNFQKPGEPPYTLMDYFPKDFLCIVDESHITLPQLRGMYNGNLSRKQTLVDYGFRLESALDNRPLNFKEWEGKLHQILFVSATPNEYEKEVEELRAEQLIRPTGLLDPEITVKPTKGQIDDIISEIKKTVDKKEKVMITTLTKKMAEDLTSYLKQADIRVQYLHSDIDTLERGKIIRDLRTDKFDVLVGINLLREGLDIPEISLVCILDADKEGFLRSEISLIQTVGRASRNVGGHVIMYADTVTRSMKVCIDETNRRREIQKKYNEEHGITPKTIQKKVRDLISVVKTCDDIQYGLQKDYESMNRIELEKVIRKLTKRMRECALELNFEEA
ncbi:MAG: excinuclease ABC subunit B, partial [Lachnospiraceae bacterium]|nr:excinuclease ABC subunit B [Lachnospiraceae bacterium]